MRSEMLLPRSVRFRKKEPPPDPAPDVWTTRALTEVLWKEAVPEFSVLWLAEPDRSQHAAGPGQRRRTARDASVR
jgi:hypothetical protein